jgi:hypothetical protein
MVGGDAQMTDTMESAEDLAASPEQVTSTGLSPNLWLTKFIAGRSYLSLRRAAFRPGIGKEGG